MTKTRTTKHALLLSGLSLLLCLSMLVGSTFAWLSDKAVSSGNILEAGILEIAMDTYDSDKAEWVDASQTPILVEKNWGPGDTQMINVRIANRGNLALQWQAMVTLEGQKLSELADVIDVYVLTAPDDTARTYLAETDLDEDTKVTHYTLKEFITQLPGIAHGTMQPGGEFYLRAVLRLGAVDNKYQGMDLGATFVLNVLATQYTQEADTFDASYDAQAQYAALPEGGTQDGN